MLFKMSVLFLSTEIKDDQLAFCYKQYIQLKTLYFFLSPSRFHS